MPFQNYIELQTELGLKYLAEHLQTSSSLPFMVSFCLYSSLAGRVLVIAPRSEKYPPAMQETWVQSLGHEDPLEEGTVTHSGILAWEILWTEEPGGLQSMGSQGQTRLSD